MKTFGNILWGIVFVVVGLIWALNSLGITDINIFFDGWWTLFIIIPSLIGLFKENSKTGSIVGVIIGVALLLVAQDFLSFSILWKLALPAAFIIIGLSIMFSGAIQKGINDKIKSLNKEGLEEYYATFGGQKLDFDGEEFKGVSLNAVFGGIELDLRDAIINGEKMINISAIFGGVEIRVPQGVNVKVKSTPIFGGVGSEIKQIKGENIPTIYVNAFCLFGGAEIK